MAPPAHADEGKDASRSEAQHKIKKARACPSSARAPHHARNLEQSRTVLPNPQGPKLSPLPALGAATALQWHVEVTQRMGRHVVADADLPAGTLVLLERPFLTLPMAKYCSVVCHRCLRPLPKTAGTQPAAPAAGVNPCLPRYCAACKDAPRSLDAQLAALRIKLPELAAPHQVDPTMLHILALLDLQRSGLPAAAPPAAGGGARGGPAPLEAHAAGVQCSVADADALPALWDRKPEAWRRKVGAAVRALHKELAALAAAVPGYSPRGLQRLQADAAQMSLQVQTINATSSGPDTGIGLFPALCVFPHSCLPNCFFLALGSLLCVRTIVDVAKGEPLTVAYVSLLEPRAQRQAALEAERHCACACARCAQPLAESIDRWLEGVYCSTCMADVAIPVPEGADNDRAREDYLEGPPARKLPGPAAGKQAARKKHSKGKAPGKPAANGKEKRSSVGEAAQLLPQEQQQQRRRQQQQQEEVEAARCEQGGGADGEAARADGGATANGTDDAAAEASAAPGEAANAGGCAAHGGGGAGGCAAHGGGGAGVAADDGDPAASLPEGVAFWRCCNKACAAVEPAHTTVGSGPGDLLGQAVQALQEAAVLVNTKHPQLVAQGEALLQRVQGGLDGRLPPHHHTAFAALTPLINLHIRKAEPMRVMHYAVTLWTLEREVLEQRPTLQQLQCLEAIIEAAEHKAANASSGAIKRSFEKKLKEATEHRAQLKRILLGR